MVATMIVLNQHQINLAVARIHGNPAEALRLRDTATAPEERALWSLVHRQISRPTPQKKAGCHG
jgi:hypothetical protein